ncbi:hypothetical protein MMC10_002156 [Thelotrema lepadinum]|nr:hypothetical protein [Thelotrema lepadinum]
MDREDIEERAVASTGPSKPRFLIIGAGSRGNAYAEAVTDLKTGIISSVADPIASKRQSLGKKHIWNGKAGQEDQEFDSWEQFLKYEVARRKRESSGERVLPGVDGVFVCTLDHTHVEIITSLAPLKLHIMSEKPLATNLEDCIRIYKCLQPPDGSEPETVFSVGHVLRYSPHNMLLRKLLLQDFAIGEIISIEHTEPVGWWHFSHSYVRGNWRKESSTAPSLLTKSCHDIDFLLWILTSSRPNEKPHLPDQIASFGSLSFFKKSRKPKEAGNATNCLSCDFESDCMYSAKKIYLEKHLLRGNADWPVKIVEPEIEDLYMAGNKEGAQEKLISALKEDYTSSMSQTEIDKRPWFGRCVWEADNDVCDDQTVTLSWKDEDSDTKYNRSAKMALFHMIPFTEKQCERRGRVYGTKGEIEYDSKSIRVYTFADQRAETYHPHQPGGGHGGGDAGLAGSFVKAVADVMDKKYSVSEAQKKNVGCTLEDVIRSHAMVFAAEEARTSGTVVDWQNWWKTNVVEKKDMNGVGRQPRG